VVLKREIVERKRYDHFEDEYQENTWMCVSMEKRKEREWIMSTLWLAEEECMRREVESCTQ